MVKYFSSTLADLPVWSSYSVENPLAAASEEKNSTVEVISEVLKHARLKAAFRWFVNF